MSLTVKEAIMDLKIHNGYVQIAFDSTMMTVPKILLNALQSVVTNPKTYLKELASQTKRDLLKANVSNKEIRGKLSTKVQEIAWNAVFLNKQEVDLKDLSKSVTIPYRCNGEATTMTIPYFLFKVIFNKNLDIIRKNFSSYNEEQILKKAKKDTQSYIANIASNIKTELLKETERHEDLSMKLSQKIHEFLILDEISESAKRQRVIL